MQDHNERKLPISFPPIIVNYLHFAHFITILLSNKKSLPWFYANFIHILYNRQANQKLNFFMQNQFDCNSNFFIDTYRLHNKIININKIDIIKNIIGWIENEYYVKIKVHSKFISNNYLLSSNNYFLLHVLIFGYNQEKRIFYTQNFTLKKSYSIIEVPFDDIKNAFYSDLSRNLINTTPYLQEREQAEDYFIVLYKVNKNFTDYYDFSYYLNKIKTDLIAYIKGEDALLKSNAIIKLNDDMHYNPKEYYWGIHAYDGITEMILFDYNIFHGLFEHKNIMLNRLNYLISKKILTSSELSETYNREVVKPAEYLRFLCLKTEMTKYNSMQLKNLEDKITGTINKIKEKEEKILTAVIKRI